MLDTVTVVTSWPGGPLREQLRRVQELKPDGEIVWNVSRGESVEGSWSSRIRVRDAPGNIQASCGVERYGRVYLCDVHKLRVRGRSDRVSWLEAGRDLDEGPGAVSECDERVWVPRWEGHYDRGVSVSGSLAKYLQGHNVTSPWQGVDILKLLDGFLFEWQDRYCDGVCYEGMRGVPFTMIMAPFPVAPETLIDVSRLDLALTFRVGETRRDAEDWLRGMRYSVRARKSSSSDDSSVSVSGAGEDTTVYIGKHSSERTWKAYLKDVEIQKKGRHRLFDERPDIRDMAVEFLRGTVRLELTLRRSWLLGTGVPVFDSDLQVQMEHWDRLGKGQNMRISQALPDGLEKLKAGAKSAYLLWERGENVRLHFKKPTFYKYRRLVLDATKVDIGIQRQPEGVLEPKELDYSREFLESIHVAHEEFPPELRDADRESVLPFGSVVT